MTKWSSLYFSSRVIFSFMELISFKLELSFNITFLGCGSNVSRTDSPLQSLAILLILLII